MTNKKCRPVERAAGETLAEQAFISTPTLPRNANRCQLRNVRLVIRVASRTADHLLPVWVDARHRATTDPNTKRRSAHQHLADYLAGVIRASVRRNINDFVEDSHV